MKCNVKYATNEHNLIAIQILIISLIAFEEYAIVIILAFFDEHNLSFMKF